ncbi:MAG: phosphoribosyltransferase [Candidatus Heimdallarchaeota archaeon]
MTAKTNGKPRLVQDPALRNQTHIFENRYQAGKLLAKKLERYRDYAVIVLAIPAGGVPVGVAIAEHLQCGFHLMITRKIQIPWQPEAGYGAVAPDGSVVLNEPLVQQLHLTRDEIKQHVAIVLKEIDRRSKKFLGGVSFPNLTSKIVLLTDDGLASGFTMLAAIRAVMKQNPAKVIVAVPTAPASTINRISGVDVIICLNVRDSRFFAVADAYVRWHDLSDREVEEYLKKVDSLQM